MSAKGNEKWSLIIYTADSDPCYENLKEQQTEKQYTIFRADHKNKQDKPNSGAKKKSQILISYIYFVGIKQYKNMVHALYR